MASAVQAEGATTVVEGHKLEGANPWLHAVGEIAGEVVDAESVRQVVGFEGSPYRVFLDSDGVSRVACADASLVAGAAGGGVEAKPRLAAASGGGGPEPEVDIRVLPTKWRGNRRRRYFRETVEMMEAISLTTRL